MKRIFLLLTLFSSLAFGADHLLYAPSGNLILDAKTGSTVKINKTLQVDKIVNLAGTSGAPGMVPIGGMVAVMPNTHANAWQPPATGVIKDGFMRADGAVVPACSDCVIPAGATLPNMVSRFPKGSTTSGTTAGSATKNLPAHYHGFGSGTSMTAAGQTLGTSNVSLSSGTAVSPGSEHQHAVVPAENTTGGSVLWLSSWSGGGSGASTVNIMGYTQVDGAHTHGVSGTTNIGHSHGSSSVSGTVGLGSGSGGCDGNSGSSCSINVEPAYMEVVWIIRVK